VKNRWKSAVVCINLAVAAVILILALENQIASFSDLVRIVVRSLIYANLTGGLGFIVLGSIAERASRRQLPLMPVITVGLIAYTAVSCLAAQVVLMAMGSVSAEYFWPGYRGTLQIAIPLAVMFGLGAFVYAALQERVHFMERKLREKDVAEERTRKLLAEAKLQALESRIHPHFLFNTLNSIMSLIVANPALADQMVGRLASLLRTSLDSADRPLIPLNEELGMVESYLDIEKVRFGDKLRSAVNVHSDLFSAKVPPMSVQSLVENAVKHGVTPEETSGEVSVHAFAEDDLLRIEVRDSGRGFELAAIHAGHGLDNLVGRLDALFGAKARLNVLRRDGISVVEMTLPRV
jgi:two-component system, LytTR family, sensor histidine kinase AlgZ